MYMKVGATWYEIAMLESVDEAKVHTLDPDYVKKALDNPKRFDPVNTKRPNAKSIGSRRKNSDEKNLLAIYTKALKPGADKPAYDKAKKAWATYKAKMDSEFKDLVSQLEGRKLTKAQFMKKSRTLFKAGYEKAYRLGTDASGLSAVAIPKEDLAWLARARSAEYKFLDKFADDIVAKRGSMAYSARAGMYIDSVDSMFDAGRVDAYPNEGTLIYWELSSAENCGDCIDLAMNSPYTPETLPTTPRAGGTMCLSHCGCSLRIRYEKRDSVDLAVQVVPLVVARALAKGEVNKAISWDVGVDDFESVRTLNWNLLDDMMSALATLRVLSEQEPTAYRIREERIALSKFEQASMQLPEWLDPFSRDVYRWHAIGTVVLDKRKEVE